MSDQYSTSAAGAADSDRPLLADDRHHEEASSPQRRDSPHEDADADESTPLIPREDGDVEADADSSEPRSIWSRLGLKRRNGSKKSRWPTVLAVSLLCIALVVILWVGFAIPEVMQEYGEQAAVFEPTKLSIDSFTAEGIKARVQGDFYLDGSKVQKKPVRDLGRAGTWIAGAVETDETTVTVSLPEYDIELGTVDIPPITVSVRDGERSPIDIVADIVPGKVEGLRQIAEEWLAGRLDQLQLQGKADVALKSGIFSFGTQKIIQTLTFDGDKVPAVPEYNISRLNIHEMNLPGVGKVMSADVKISAFNKHPVSLSVPPMAFDILIPGCTTEGPRLMLANATTEEIKVEPKKIVTVAARGIVHRLPSNIVSTCPGTESSPLDSLLGDYIHGDETTMYVRGSASPALDTPPWITDIIKSITVAVPLSGHSMGKLIRNFTMEDTHFALPNPLADPNSPEAQPRISARIEVLANLPEEMNFPINVTRVRSTADVLHKDKKLGVLDLQKWQNATSHRIEGDDKNPALLSVEAEIEHAPLSITDQHVFTEVIREMLLGDGLVLGIQASVDIEISSILGVFAVRGIPAEGKVPLSPLLKKGILGTFSPSISNLSILDTEKSSMKLGAIVNLTNPTKYSAHVPYINIQILNNGTLLGNATATNADIKPGVNDAILIQAIWDPPGLSGENGTRVARDLLSSFISGRNTSLTLRAHAGSIPSVPEIGDALSKFEFEIPTPKLNPPKAPGNPDDDGPDGKPHFIDEATMHLVSSTADFLLLSPLRHNTIYLTKINATAIYNGTDPIGEIFYDLPIMVPPGSSKTPRLPVDWSLGSVGYDAMLDALGGTLKLGAKAVVGVRVDRWEQTIDYAGDGIGAHIQL